LLMLRLLRLRSRRVDLMEVDAEGKRMSLSRRGFDIFATNCVVVYAYSGNRACDAKFCVAG
jgi:hypothetical protein